MTSAIKVDGNRPLRTRSRRGKHPAKPRPIEVFDISLLHHEGNHFDFVCTVSKGTYIRVLGEDIAKKSWDRGLSHRALRRLSIGPWQLRHAHKLESLDEHSFIDPTILVTGMKHLELDDEQAQKAKNGVALALDARFRGESLSDSTYRRDRGLLLRE
jgi:tRNA pseudouridine55 synthase